VEQSDAGDVQVQDFESNPQLVQIVPPNETVVVVGFELKMGNRAGTMSLCIPYNVIEPIMGLLAAQNWFSYQRKGRGKIIFAELTRNVSNAPVELRAFLAQTTIRLNDLLSLQVGDLITTDKECDARCADPGGGEEQIPGAGRAVSGEAIAWPGLFAAGNGAV
jgi:flagellar motor switch protein FliM